MALRWVLLRWWRTSPGAVPAGPAAAWIAGGAFRALPRRLRDRDLLGHLRPGLARRPVHLARGCRGRSTITDDHLVATAVSRDVGAVLARAPGPRAGGRDRPALRPAGARPRSGAALFFRYHGFPWDARGRDHASRSSTGLNYASDVIRGRAGPGERRAGQPAHALLLAGGHLRAAEPSGDRAGVPDAPPLRGLRAGQRCLGRGAVRDGRACASASDAWLAAGGGARYRAGAAPAAKSPPPCQNGTPDAPLAPPRRCRHGGDRRRLEHPGAVPGRRLADLGRLHLSLRLPGHRPDEPAARAAARPGGWWLAGFVVGLACSFVGSQIEGPFGPLVSLRVAIGSGDGVPGRPAPRRRGLQPAAGRQLVAGAVRVERRWAACVDTAIFFTIAFSAEPRLHRAGGRRRLGERGGAAPRPRRRWRRSGCRSRLPISWSSSASPCSRWRRFAPRSGCYAQRALKFGLRFAAGRWHDRGNRNQRKEVIQCLVRLWSVRPGLREEGPPEGQPPGTGPDRRALALPASLQAHEPRGRSHCGPSPFRGGPPCCGSTTTSPSRTGS